MYNNHRNELHLMALNKHIRDLWIEGLQNLIDKHGQKSQRHLIKEEKQNLLFEMKNEYFVFFSWILNYFRKADRDRSNSLTKKECQRLLRNSLNVKVPENLFEQLFEVKIFLKDLFYSKYIQRADKDHEGLLDPDEFVGFFHLLTQRKDLYRIMQK